MSGRAHEKCKVAGCLGMTEITTDGNGRTVDRCAYCEKRAAFERQYAPKRKAYCVICTAPVEVKNARGREPQTCEACKPILARAKKAGYQPQKSRPAIATTQRNSPNPAPSPM